MEASAEDRAVALISSAVLVLVRYGCMEEKEADGLDWILIEKVPSAKELRSLIIELEDRALGCEKLSSDAVSTIIKILKEAWTEVRGYE